jgi:hypothetical protein
MLYGFPYEDHVKYRRQDHEAPEREIVRQGRTMSELLESALRAMFQSRKARKDLPPLPVFDGGIPRVNVANREALEDFMKGR